MSVMSETVQVRVYSAADRERLREMGVRSISWARVVWADPVAGEDGRRLVGNWLCQACGPEEIVWIHNRGYLVPTADGRFLVRVKVADIRRPAPLDDAPPVSPH
jgi:hypothetical protein